MPVKEQEVVEARSKQRARSKRATFELLKNKPRAEREVEINFPTADGPVEVTMLFRAIGAQEYDKLISKNPPNTEQKADGASYNVNTFGPDLLSHVCVDPELEKREWLELWNSPDWNRGEMMQMFLLAVELCNKGLDIPLFDND